MNLAMKRSWSIKTKLALFVPSILLLSTWSLALYASRLLYQDLGSLAETQQFSAVSFIAAQINEALDIRRKSLEQVAGDITPEMMRKTTRLQEFLERQQPLLTLFNAGVFAADSDGVAIADVPLPMTRVGVNYMDRTAVSLPLQGGKAMVGPPAVGKTVGAPIFSLSAPILDAQKKPIGVVVGTINLNLPSFLDEVTNRHYGQTGGYVLVAPQDYLVVTATDKSRIMTPTSEPGKSALIDRFAQGYEGSGITINPSGVEVLTSAKGVPVAGWYVVAYLPTAEAFAPIRLVQRRIFLAAIFLTMGLGGLTWWWLRGLLSPIFATTATLAAMTEAHIPLTTLAVVRHDEVGQLVGSINDLLHALSRREQSLKESEEKRSSILRSAIDGFWLADLEGRILESNVAYCTMSGYSEEALLMLHVGELDATEGPIKAAARIRAVVSQGHACFETQHRRKDGSVFDVEIIAQYHAFDGGRFTIFIRDISIRKRNEQLILQSQENYRRVFENEMIAIIIFDPESLQILDVNSAHVRIYGYTLEETLELMIPDLSAEPEASRVFLQSAKNLLSFTVPCRHHRKKDGTVFPVEIVGNGYERDGRWVMVAFVRDISDRMRMEEALQKSDREFRSLAESMPQIVWIARCDGWLTYFNHQWSEYTGLSGEESFGHVWNKPFHPDDRQRVWDAWNDAIGKQTDYSVECRMRRADGVFKWWLIRGLPVLDADGNVLKWFGTCTDIDDIKRKEAELQESEERLSAAAQAANFGVYSYDFENHRAYYSSELFALYGLPPGGADLDLDEDRVPRSLHPDDKPGFLAAIREANDPFGLGILEHEFRICLAGDQVRWLRISGKTMFSGNGAAARPVNANGILLDISEKKIAEEALRNAQVVLEQRVAERTADLEKTNATLSMMLDYARKAEIDIQERVVANLRSNSLLLIDSIKKERLSKGAQNLVEILESTTHNLADPFARSLGSPLLKLSSRELQVATFVRQGKTTKEIMSLLNLSFQTVQSHRNNLRRKLGLRQKKVNLRTYLNSKFTDSGTI